MILTYVCGLVGISFLSNADLVTAQTQFLADNPSIATYLETTANTSLSLVDGQWKFHFSKDIFSYFTSTLIPAVQNYFSRSSNHVVFKTTDPNYLNLGDAFIQASFTGSLENQFIQCYYTGAGAISLVDYLGNNHTITCNVADNVASIYLDGNPVTTYQGASGMKVDITGLNNAVIKWGMFQLTTNGITRLIPIIRYQYTVGDTYMYSGYGNLEDYYYGDVTINKADLEAIYSSRSLPYQYAIDYSLSEFNLALQKALAAFQATLDIPFDINREVVETGKAEVEDPTKEKVPYVPDWATWWDKLGIKELIESVKQNTAVTEQDVKMPNLPVSIKDKFPFCVPFDLYYMIQKLNATGVAPSWNIPFKIQSLGINETIVLSLSGWESVAVVCRWAFTLMFILALVLLTRNIIRA